MWSSVGNCMAPIASPTLSRSCMLQLMRVRFTTLSYSCQEEVSMCFLTEVANCVSGTSGYSAA